MTKKMAPKKAAKGAGNSVSVGGYKVLGETRDGVRILKPKGEPESFTVTELRKAIRAARAGKTA